MSEDLMSGLPPESKITALDTLNNLRNIAQRDPLTGAFNRSALSKEQLRLEKEGISYGLIFVDLDLFKQFNDKYGHDIGDKVLIDTVRVLGDNLRIARETNPDKIIKYGGEEFVIILPEISSLEDVAKIAEKLRQKVAEERLQIEKADGSKLEIQRTLSAGVALKDPRESAESVIKRADSAVYKAKEAGRNRVEVAEQNV